MNGIGELFRVTREEAGVSLGEASKDLDIKEVILENIEDGNIGCFKDIFILKENIYSYAKYLGIDPEKIIDEFNEYMFEYTSRIPIKEIEQKLKDQDKNQEKNSISSPYTMSNKKRYDKHIYLIYALIILLLVGVVFFAIRQVTTYHETASVISYVK